MKIAPPNKLAEIGVETFYLLEESIGPVPMATMPLHSAFQRQLSQVYCFTRESFDSDSDTAAQKSKGVIIVEYFVNKPVPAVTPVPRKLFFKDFCVFMTLQ